MARDQKPKTEVLTKQVLKAFPELKSANKARNLVKLVSQQISIKSGPYPSPEDYAHYHDIDPSLTDLMKKMVLMNKSINIEWMRNLWKKIFH